MKLNPKIEACNICGQMVDVNNLDQMLEHVTKDFYHKKAVEMKIEEFLLREGDTIFINLAGTILTDEDLGGEE